MKVRYTPGTPEGLVGDTYTVEIVAISLIEDKFVACPLLHEVKIKYKNNKTEWISGNKLFNSINMVQKAVSKRVY
jgi:hypothetical protein